MTLTLVLLRVLHRALSSWRSRSVCLGFYEDLSMFQSECLVARHEIEEESEHCQGDSWPGRAFPQKLKGLPLLCCKVINDSLSMIFRDDLTLNPKFFLLLDFDVITTHDCKLRLLGSETVDDIALHRNQ